LCLVLPLADRNPTTRRPVVTVLLILVNVGVFVFWQGGGSVDSDAATTFSFEHAAIPCELVTGHRLTVEEFNRDTCESNPSPREHVIAPDKNVYLAALVSMFLHGGWLHLLGNMLFLWIFGNNIEDKLGPAWYLAFYVAGGVVATFTQVLYDTGSVVPMVGASGAIAAVMGAYVVWFPWAPIVTFAFFFVFALPAIIWLGIWFVLQFFTGPDSGVAFMAHVGGFVFGVVVAFLLRNSDWWRRRAGSAYQYRYRAGRW
jgi:membrane associated rhomboid family serine protease